MARAQGSKGELPNSFAGKRKMKQERRERESGLSVWVDD